MDKIKTFHKKENKLCPKFRPKYNMNLLLYIIDFLFYHEKIACSFFSNRLRNYFKFDKNSILVYFFLIKINFRKQKGYNYKQIYNILNEKYTEEEIDLGFVYYFNSLSDLYTKKPLTRKSLNGKCFSVDEENMICVHRIFRQINLNIFIFDIDPYVKENYFLERSIFSNEKYQYFFSTPDFNSKCKRYIFKNDKRFENIVNMSYFGMDNYAKDIIIICYSANYIDNLILSNRNSLEKIIIKPLRSNFEIRNLYSSLSQCTNLKEIKFYNYGSFKLKFKLEKTLTISKMDKIEKTINFCGEKINEKDIYEEAFVRSAKYLQAACIYFNSRKHNSQNYVDKNKYEVKLLKNSIMNINIYWNKLRKLELSINNCHFNYFKAWLENIQMCNLTDLCLHVDSKCFQNKSNMYVNNILKKVLEKGGKLEKVKIIINFIFFSFNDSNNYTVTWSNFEIDFQEINEDFLKFLIQRFVKSGERKLSIKPYEFFLLLNRLKMDEEKEKDETLKQFLKQLRQLKLVSPYLLSFESRSPFNTVVLKEFPKLSNIKFNLSSLSLHKFEEFSILNHINSPSLFQIKFKSIQFAKNKQSKHELNSKYNMIIKKFPKLQVVKCDIFNKQIFLIIKKFISNKKLHIITKKYLPHKKKEKFREELEKYENVIYI